MKRKFMLCRYPDNGFGSRSGMFYLLDVWGNRYDIKDEYNAALKEMVKVVCLEDNIHSLGTFSESSLGKLIERIELDTNSKIDRW